MSRLSFREFTREQMESLLTVNRDAARGKTKRQLPRLAPKRFALVVFQPQCKQLARVAS